MVARPYWQGHIRLALVSIPVQIFSASKSGPAMPFHQIHEPSGKRIHYEKVAEGIGPVDPDDIIKGYEYEKGSYVLLDEEEIDAVKLESRKTLELVQFVDREGIDPIYFNKPYYVVPADDLAEEAFIVLREAMRRAKKVGVGQLAMRGREYVVSLKPCGRGLVLETLRYAEELNQAASYFRSIPDKKPDDELLELATSLIEKRTAQFDASHFHNRYGEALRALVEQKMKSKGRKIHAEEEATPRSSADIVDLMAALKKSLDNQEAGGGARKSRSTAASKSKTTRAAPARERKRA